MVEPTDQVYFKNLQNQEYLRANGPTSRGGFQVVTEPSSDLASIDFVEQGGAGFCADHSGAGFSTLRYDVNNLNECKMQCLDTATAIGKALVGLEWRPPQDNDCNCRFEGLLDCPVDGAGANICWNPSTPGTGPVTGTRYGPGWTCYKNENFADPFAWKIQVMEYGGDACTHCVDGMCYRSLENMAWTKDSSDAKCQTYWKEIPEGWELANFRCDILEQFGWNTHIMFFSNKRGYRTKNMIPYGAAACEHYHWYDDRLKQDGNNFKVDGCASGVMIQRPAAGFAGGGCNEAYRR